MKMGCAASKAAEVSQNSNILNGQPASSDKVFQDARKTSTGKEVAYPNTSAANAEHDKITFGKPNCQAKLPDSPKREKKDKENLGNTFVVPDSQLTIEKTPGNMDLQERLRILSTRRRSLQFEIGSDETNDEMDSIYLRKEATARRASLQPPAQEFPKRKSIFPPPPLTRDDYSPPFGPKRKLSLTDSQKEFFRLLDEKVAQGKDYHSEDDESISSFVSRNGNRKLSTILDALRSQHAR